MNDPSATDSAGFTRLMSAAYRGNEKAVRQLLQAGVDVNARSRDGWTGT